MNTTIASKRAARSATACGGFEGAPGFDANLAAMVRVVGKSDAAPFGLRSEQNIEDYRYVTN